MLVWSIAALGMLGAMGWWLAQRRSPEAGPGAPASGAQTPQEQDEAHPMPDAAALLAARERVNARLWQLAYGAKPAAGALEKSHAEVRVAVVARLQPEKLNPEFLPRRPTLMQQLLREVSDPGAQADKLSRMIAHDPVLGADVLRIANSSLYRVTPEPVESIQRAIVICGVESMRGILATAMVRPVFKATGRNFPRLPRLLWERTERAARAAELYAIRTSPQDCFEAQMAVLLRALGPLVVHSAALDAYAQRPRLQPDANMLVELTQSMAGSLSARIAQEWDSSPRIVSALGDHDASALAVSMMAGEFLGTLSLLVMHAAMTDCDALDLSREAGLDESLAREIIARINAV